MVWLVLSSIIVIFDALYILNRPHTLPGGKYGHIYGPYEIYTRYDALYGPAVKDYFADIIAWLNLAEVAVTFLGLLLYFCSPKLKMVGSLLAILASAFVLWKTVLYIWYDWQYMSEAAREFHPDGIAFYWLPNSFWIVCPLWSILSIGRQIGKAVLKAEAPEKKKKA